MPWHPPIPAEAVYSDEVARIGAGLRLLWFLYNCVNRDGTVNLSLKQASGALKVNYETLRDHWQAIKREGILSVVADHGKRGLVLRFADDWLDWHVVEANYRSSTGSQRGNTTVNDADPPRSTGFQRENTTVEAAERTVNGSSTGGQRGNTTVEAVHKGTHDSQESESFPNGGGMMNPDLPPPPREAVREVETEVPKAIETAYRSVFKPDSALNQFERKKLLALLGTYGADWLIAGIEASAVQNGKSLGYLEALLKGCKRDGKPPGSPRGKTNGRQATPHRSERFDYPAQPELSADELEQLRNAPPLQVTVPRRGG